LCAGDALDAALRGSDQKEGAPNGLRHSVGLCFAHDV